MYTKFSTILFLLVILNTLQNRGQSFHSDTLYLPEKDAMYDKYETPDALKDTTILSFPEKKIKRKESREDKTGKFFKNLENQANHKRWIRELHNIIVVSPAKPTREDSVVTVRTAGRFVQYKGLIINEIKIVKLDVFGVDMYDDTATPKSFIDRTANKLHIKTQDRVLQRYILFRPGESVDPSVLADNERIIRELPFIEDARIIVENIPENPESVNIILITKDTWSKAFFLEVKDINYYKLELFDKNIFGTGLEIQNNFHWNPEKKDALGYEAVYKTSNILGSFINSRFYYTNVFETESYGYRLERKFFTPNTKYAGGTTACYLNTINNIWHPDSGYFEEKIKTNYLDLWLGRSFLLNRENPERLNFIVTSGLMKETFHDRPVVGENSFYAFHNKTTWLNSIALARQSFYKSNLIYSFGRTEDIPTGYLLNLTFGPEFGEFNNRFYSSVNYSFADYYDYLGYMYLRTAFGGFHTKNGNFEQGLLDMKISWITNLFIIGQLKLRNFLNIYYLNGYERFSEEKVYLNEPNGIRGFNQRYIYGNQKLVMNFESVIFTPLNVIGFRFATSAFIDLGFLGEKNSALIRENMFAGVGMGLRIRNERLVFPTFQLRFAYYPNLPGLRAEDMIKFLGEPRLNPEKFYPDAPAVMSF